MLKRKLNEFKGKNTFPFTGLKVEYFRGQDLFLGHGMKLVKTSTKISIERRMT